MAGTLGVTSVAYTPRKTVIRSENHMSKKITIVSGTAAMVRGTVLGQVTASMKWTALNEEAATGEQVARAILADDAVDAALADKEALAYFAGEYRDTDLTWPGTMDAAEKLLALQELADRGIIVE